ncbi:MAG: acyl-CoA reductase-like NAD-dependent aldehyde dehydrogenase [Cryomorphaceae bacterium]|jgi:acyl-CoA reductase-like NAD-dependent aldehyde dehydrogenase
MNDKPSKFDNYINGEWLSSDSYTENISPSDLGDSLGFYAKATLQDAALAIDAAEQSWAGWAECGLEQRKAVLDFIGAELINRSAEIGRVLAREEGKTLAEGAGEVHRAGQFFQYYGAETLRMMGEVAQSTRPGIDVEVRREPVGVIGVITPWNFPVAVAAWKVAPALAFGNSVVLKPAEITPASAWILTEIISRSGLPKGVFNLLMGSGREVGEAITTSPKVNAVSFTGSVAVGRHIARNVIENMGKIQLEMGSKNALVVLDDADLDVAVQCAINGAFFGTGQKCTASSRLIVEAGVHDEFVALMSKEMAKLKVGNPLQEGMQIGSMASEQQFTQVLDYIAGAKADGAVLVAGGEALELQTRGYYIAPTLFKDTNNSMRINCEEVFGPVSCVIKARDYDEALSIANDTEFGLTSGIITQSLARSAHFKKHSKSGCVMVNLPTAGTDYHVPFGGRKASSYGSREQGKYAAEFYTIVKTNYSKPY